ncbi:efflux RND transporter periplasmic adaptor subunit [Agrobacterium fabrum]|jgi:membrane fusion protein, multidrug efflux system|uniref:efflux RND transporter periplasmic adaptor subunit n=1 Tax=Agrobacterium fabrum TaxID=1176649 RepID=UPI0009BBD870|nr:efflux RND transporter periplasmic adaptor subunit [Agrobacterium fabrum]UXT59116.1 efflux RND transporter periplasmic adaptor subunit [Agrobacterium fabrum]WCK79287.1 efflux RND transporter periplasmic adaptor subunit [Agrobacterium fabrum]WIE30348.1 efflux RND transporter periplasmic adaptor subunit [Agrobacterium fabrum]WIE46308.1 efflux RND transporter periplasmic adaptor subunit [Agrobacterium fabrum]CUX49321.1 HlyD family secretion protein [Agrobacterium fabrum str. J-07]
MKRFWTALSVLAIAAAGTWYFRDRLPLDQTPYLKQFSSASPQPGAETAAQSSQNGQPARQSGQRQGGGRRNGAPPTVSTIAVAKATLPMDATATGWAVAADITNIAPLQAGLVTEISAKDGQHIKSGDLILKLDDRIARAAVDKDKANIAADQATLEQTEAAFQRATNLVKQSAESQQVLDQARAARDGASAKIDADKAALASDQVTLEHMEIRAPFDGRLGDITVSPGAYLSAGVNIVTITKYDPISVSFRLSQRYLPQLREGVTKETAVDVDPAATGGEPMRGVLRFYDNTVDQTSGTVLAKAEFKNDRGLLWPGQSVNVTAHFVSDDEMIVVPTVAVRPGPKGNFVYTVDNDHHAHMTPVQVARSNGDLTAIASGLNGGEHIIVEGQSELADGQTVVEQFSDKGGAAANLAANIPQEQVGGQ